MALVGARMEDPLKVKSLSNSVLKQEHRRAYRRRLIARLQASFFKLGPPAVEPTSFYSPSSDETDSYSSDKSSCTSEKLEVIISPMLFSSSQLPIKLILPITPKNSKSYYSDSVILPMQSFDYVTFNTSFCIRHNIYSVLSYSDSYSDSDIDYNFTFDTI